MFDGQKKAGKMWGIYAALEAVVIGSVAVQVLTGAFAGALVSSWLRQPGPFPWIRVLWLGATVALVIHFVRSINPQEESYTDFPNDGWPRGRESETATKEDIDELKEEIKALQKD